MPDRPTARMPAVAALFAGLLLLFAAAAGAAGLAVEPLTIVSGDSRHTFRVEIADDDASRQQGLMHRRQMADDAGMLFEFNEVGHVSFWMKNTLIPLDMLFVDRTGRIAHIHHGAKPHDLTPIGPPMPVWAVLELNAGMARRLGIKVGDRIEHDAFRP